MVQYERKGFYIQFDKLNDDDFTLLVTEDLTDISEGYSIRGTEENIKKEVLEFSFFNKVEVDSIFCFIR